MIDFETAPAAHTPVGPRPAVFPVLGGPAEGVPAAENFASLDGAPIADASTTAQGPRPPVVTQAYTRFGPPPAVQAAAPAPLPAAARPGIGGAVAGGYPVALPSLAETAMSLPFDVTAPSNLFGNPYGALAAPAAMTTFVAPSAPVEAPVAPAAPVAPVTPWGRPGSPTGLAPLAVTPAATSMPVPAPLPPAPVAPWGYPAPGRAVTPAQPTPDDAAGVRWQRAGMTTPALTVGEISEKSGDHAATLKAFAVELGQRGMPSSLATTLLSETVTQYGAAALARPRDLRLAFIEQLLARIPMLPLLGDGTTLAGTYVVTGAPGSGKSALVARLAREAGRQGQQNVLLVNGQERRLGAAAAMEAIGAAFGLPVAHAYSPAELREAIEAHGAAGVVLIEADSILPHASVTWPWGGIAATTLVCIPATGQGDDVRALITRAADLGPARVAILTMSDLTQNAVPALSMLAHTTCSVGLVATDPFAQQGTPALDDVTRRALRVDAAE